MPYDIPLLLLPLVGGYFILAKSIFFHHTYKRIGSQKLIFDSIIAGIILSLITWLIRKMFYFLFPSFAGHTYALQLYRKLKGIDVPRLQNLDT